MKVCIMGLGMLGKAVTDVFQRSGIFDLVLLDKDEIDVSDASSIEIAKKIEGAEWVINCIGIIKPHIHEDNIGEIITAIRVNSIFPYLLSKVNTKVIQIATDCVYSGEWGEYTETDPHDAWDTYGKTKSLGEIPADNMYHIRCSIIGAPNPLSLMGWFLSQPEGAEVNGFTDQEWNGVTTDTFAKMCLGIVKQEPDLPNVQHFIPANTVSKFTLLKTLSKYFRPDINVVPVTSPEPINRTLSTNNNNINKMLWNLAGYKRIPKIESLIKELK